ncbi:HAD family hydrolase [Intrasporangium calvum]|nr:HAD family hydrolase [Intrasporangium calvum]
MDSLLRAPTTCSRRPVRRSAPSTRPSGRGSQAAIGLPSQSMQGRDDQSPRADELLTKLRRRAGALGSAGAAPSGDEHLAAALPQPGARTRLFVALVLTVPVVALALWANDSTVGRWTQVVLTAVILGWSAGPLVAAAGRTLRALGPGPEVPVLLGALVSWAASVTDLVRGAPEQWFGAAAVAATLLLLVHHVAARAHAAAGPDVAQPPVVDRVARWLPPVVLLVAAVVLVVRLRTGHTVADSLSATVAVLFIASFPAAALAAPAALAAARARAERRRGSAPAAGTLARSASLDTVVINRTGLLTTGDLALRKIAVTGRLSKKAALIAAAAVEQGSDHPIARAIVAGAGQARVDLPRIRDFEANPGEGASARIKDTEVTVGKAALFEHVDPDLLAHADGTPGRTVFVGWGGRARAALTVEDTIRETSRPAIARLKRLGLTPYLLTEDGEAHARGLAAAVGIDPGKVRSGSRGKAVTDRDLVSELQRQGRRVAVIGRAPSDLLFEADDVDAAADTIELAQQTRSVIRQHLGWALGYNVIALVAGGLGWVHPTWAAILAAVAAFVPLASAQRLRS